jgi:hypothetical protein
MSYFCTGITSGWPVRTTASKEARRLLRTLRCARVGRIIWEHVEQTTTEYLFPIRHRGPKVRVGHCNDLVILFGREHDRELRSRFEQALKI